MKCNKIKFANFNKKIMRIVEFLGFDVNQKVYPDCKFANLFPNLCSL